MQLTNDQIEASRVDHKSVAVVAAAGAGKTLVLTERYRQLVTVAGVPLHRILAFTFTEKAAGEMRERIMREALIGPAQEVLTFIGTLHSFYARLLKRFGPRLKLDPGFKVTSETGAIIEKKRRVAGHIRSLMDQKNPEISPLVEKFGVWRLTRIFENLQDELFLPAQLRGEIPENEPWLVREARQFSQNWLKEKMTAGRLDYDDLEYLAVALLETHADIRENLQKRYLHILVDEFQDTNPLQGLFINLLYRPGVNQLFIVGDPKQSIYRFRSADVSVFRNMAKKIKKQDGAVITLGETFRIPIGLMEKLNKVFEPLFGEDQASSFFRPMVSRVGETAGKLEIIVHKSDTKEFVDQLREKEARFIAKKLALFKDSPREWDETALLFRTSSPMIIYRDALLREGIPCRLTRTESLMDKPEIGDLMILLSYLAGDTSLLAQTGILRSHFFGLSETFIDRFILSKPPDLASPYTPQLFETLNDLEKWALLHNQIARWNELKDIISPSLLIEEVMSDLGCFKSSGEARLIWEKFFSVIAELENFHPQSLKEVYGMLKEAGEGEGKKIGSLQATEATGVQLMTIHSVKGLEFKRVILPQLYAREKNDWVDYFFDPERGLALKEADGQKTAGLKTPLKETPLMEELRQKEKKEKREEAKRLLYVAMTRAKEELILFLKEPKKKEEIGETDNWNDWLIQLLKDERSEAIVLKS